MLCAPAIVFAILGVCSFLGQKRTKRPGALSEKPTAELCRGGRGRRNSLRSDTATLHLSPCGAPPAFSHEPAIRARRFLIPPCSAAPLPIPPRPAVPPLCCYGQLPKHLIFTCNARKLCLCTFDIFVVSGLEVFYEQKVCSFLKQRGCSFLGQKRTKRPGALGEKPTAELCRVGKGAAELATLRHRHPLPFPLRRSACLFTGARHPDTSQQSR